MYKAFDNQSRYTKRSSSWSEVRVVASCQASRAGQLGCSGGLVSRPMIAGHGAQYRGHMGMRSGLTKPTEHPKKESVLRHFSNEYTLPLAGVELLHLRLYHCVSGCPPPTQGAQRCYTFVLQSCAGNRLDMASSHSP